MPKKRLSWWLSALLAVMLFALTGCQAVQGLDVAQAIQNGAKVTSGASNTSIQLELIPGTGTLSADDKALMDTFNPLKLEINHAVVQDDQHLSADGVLTYSKGSIPFKLNFLENKFVIQIEGAPKPIVYDPLAAQGDAAAAALPKDIQSKLNAEIREISPAFLKLLLDKLPNPQHFTVTDVTDTINHETLNLQKAHIELNGTELASLLKTMLSGLLEDKTGLYNLISQIYDALLPIFQQEAKTQSSGMDTMLENKTLAVGIASAYVQNFLEEASKDLDKVSKDGSSTFFSDKTTFNIDLFIDSDKQVRKENIELYVPVAEPDAAVTAFKLNFTTEAWDINKPLKVDLVDLSGGSMNIASEPNSFFAFYNQLDKQSAFYKLLKDDLHVTRKVIHLAMNESGNLDEYAMQPYINADNVTMVPARFISEQLGAKVEWNGDLQQVTITDALTGKKIVLTLDNKTATVNGSSVQLESAATLHNSSTFVPVRFIAETLGCKVEFDEDTRVVTIKRD